MSQTRYRLYILMPWIKIIRIGETVEESTNTYSYVIMTRTSDSSPARADFTTKNDAIVGVIPALGIRSRKIIQERLFNSTVVGFALVVGGIILVYIEMRKPLHRISSVEQPTYKTALLIGLIQCLAMIPGTSRSAATVIGAMLLGASRVVAAEFSFFLAIPTMVAASGYTLLKSGSILTPHEFLVLAVGLIVSFVVAWLVIAEFMNYVSKRDFKPFGYYRIVLGIIVLVYFTFLKF